MSAFVATGPTSPTSPTSPTGPTGPISPIGAAGSAPEPAASAAPLVDHEPLRLNGTSPLGREIVYTLEHARQYLARGARAEADPALVLRAARASWLIGDVSSACDYYRTAVPLLQDAAETVGRATGTAPEYFRLALACASMAATYATPEAQRADRAALRALATLLAHLCERMAASAVQPLDRVAVALLALRTDWHAADPEWGRTLSRADQRAAALDTNNRALWTGGRDQLLLAALNALLRERPERVAIAVQDLDEALAATMVRPPTVMDLLDEEVIALGAAAVERGARLLPLRLGPKPGSRMGEVAG